MFNYGQQKILEVFNILPSWSYWVLFPTDNFHIAVDTAKRILTTVKLDRQLAGQGSGATLFYSLKRSKRT